MHLEHLEDAIHDHLGVVVAILLDQLQHSLLTESLVPNIARVADASVNRTSRSFFLTQLREAVFGTSAIMPSGGFTAARRVTVPSWLMTKAWGWPVLA